MLNIVKKLLLNCLIQAANLFFTITTIKMILKIIGRTIKNMFKL